MDVSLSAAALAGGMAWASGLRLYMTLFMAGALGRLGWLELPPSLQVLESPWVLGVAGLLLALWLMPKLWRGMRWLFRKFST
jgi:hypothetical protein